VGSLFPGQYPASFSALQTILCDRSISADPFARLNDRPRSTDPPLYPLYFPPPPLRCIFSLLCYFVHFIGSSFPLGLPLLCCLDSTSPPYPCTPPFSATRTFSSFEKDVAFYRILPHVFSFDMLPHLAPHLTVFTFRIPPRTPVAEPTLTFFFFSLEQGLLPGLPCFSLPSYIVLLVFRTYTARVPSLRLFISWTFFTSPFFAPSDLFEPPFLVQVFAVSSRPPTYSFCPAVVFLPHSPPFYTSPLLSPPPPIFSRVWFFRVSLPLFLFP